MLWLGLALAADVRPVRAGETAESIAAKLGMADPVAGAAEIRTLNGLGPTEQPVVGTLLTLPDPPEEHGQQRTFLIRLAGSATFVDAAGRARTLETWQPIPLGSRVCTRADSRGTLRLASTCNDDGSQTDDIVLAQNTCLTVDSSLSTAAGRSTVVTVTQGSVRVQEAQANGHITVVTPSGVTTSRRGGYRVTIEDAAARTEALYADVAVQGAGEEVALDPGQGSRVETGKAPSPPVSLLPAGTPRDPGDQAVLTRPVFTWDPVDEAFGYRLEIAADPAFTSVLYAEDVPVPPYDARILMLPYDRYERFYWRVASFDRLGFLGIPSEPSALRIPPSLR